MPKPSPSWFEKVDELEAPTREGTPWSADGHRQYFKKYLVIVRREAQDDIERKMKTLGASTVCQAPGIPLPGALYTGGEDPITEEDTLAQAVNISATKPDPTNPFIWHVTVEFSTRVPEGGLAVDPGWADMLGGAANNPWLEPWHIEWDPDITLVTPQKDLDGMPFTNSATQPVSPPPQLEQARATLLIIRNEQHFNAATINKYAFACNSEPFFGYAPGTVRCRPPRAVQMYRGTLKYFRARWVLEFGLLKPKTIAEEVGMDILRGIFGITEESYKDLESWEFLEYLDAGLCRLQNNPNNPESFNKPVPILAHGGGNPITQPDLLDGKGQPVVPGTNGWRQPTFLKRRVRRKLPFDPIFTQGLGEGI